MDVYSLLHMFDWRHLNFWHWRHLISYSVVDNWHTQNNRNRELHFKFLYKKQAIFVPWNYIHYLRYRKDFISLSRRFKTNPSVSKYMCAILTFQSQHNLTASKSMKLPYYFPHQVVSISSYRNARSLSFWSGPELPYKCFRLWDLT